MPHAALAAMVILDASGLVKPVEFRNIRTVYAVGRWRGRWRESQHRSSKG